ncbi:hypothetical protein M413DRAFT_28931 [Hebeloma cylindrosporum]|uniref:Macro domain-containing protein n=1 Tax=Hebeloma cylindrosporum TaxID=76867 RepID=A0A0C2YFB2_HEBCY|nr:hypothetical protein M413DRAFT_28931 [Hebeloma cylindrosporum h7]
MSAHDPPSPHSARSASPVSISSESEADENVVRLSSIKTLAEFYRTLVLKAATPEKVRHQPDPALLDRVSLFQGDITRLEIDAIVNAANRSLLGGGGVDGAIHASAGPENFWKSRTLNGCLTGESKITRGYNLPASHIIHTVGPIYSSRDKAEKAELLESSYRTSLELAVENGIRHIAFPSISTGVYSYPVADATRIALNTARTFLESENGNKLERVIFVVWSNKDKGVYEELIPEFFPPGEKPQPAEPISVEPDVQSPEEKDSDISPDGL